MKKHILSLASITLVAGALILTGCKKDDTTAPVITLTGDAAVTISLNSTYTDGGATAEDDRDGDLTSKITNDASTVVNKDLTGTYTVTYTVTDEAGNAGTATRTVTVKNDAAAAFEGTYNGSETDALGPYTYAGNTDAAKVVTLTADNAKNNRINMTRLGDYANNNVHFDVTGNNIDLPSQTVANVGTGTAASCDLHTRTSAGTGTKTATGFTLTYSDSKVSPCTGNRVNVAATFTKK